MTLLDRRTLLRRGALAAAGLATPGLATPGLAFAAAPTDRRFVFIILRGAMDGLNVVMPVGDPAYRGLRGPLADPAGDVRKLDAMFALHPALDETGALYGRGEVLFVHAIASPYRERSHFDGQNVLETGGTAAYAIRDGWLNRALGALPAMREAVAVAPAIPMALRGPAPVTSYAPSALPKATDEFLGRVAGLYERDPELHALWSRAMEAREMATGETDRRSNPAALARLAASFLARADGPRVAVIEQQGWDTHANQAGRLNIQLKQLDAMIAALRDGLGPEWRRTVVLAATEFGRTAAANGTGGTDHGTGGLAIVAGGAVAGGRVIADWPGLTPSQLHDGRDLRPTTDMRSLMAGIACGHLGLDAATLPRIFPGGTVVRPLPGLVRA